MKRIDSYLLLRPNWGEGVKYSRIWRTGIQETLAGREKRSMLQSKVRRKLSYEADMYDSAKMNYLKRELFKYLDKIWGIPVWPDLMVLTSPVSIDDTVINVADTRYRDIENNGIIIFVDVDDPDNYEAHFVQSFTQTTITLKTAMDATWAVADTEIFPVMRARVMSGQSFSAITSGMGRISLDADEAIITTTTSGTTTTATTESTTTTTA